MRGIAERAPAPGKEPVSILGVDADAFGEGAPEPSLVFSAGHVATRKLAALRCHRSQVAGSPLDRIAEGDAERLLGTEHYRRAPVGSRTGTLLERLATPAAFTGS